MISSAQRKWLALALLLGVQFMVVLDIAIVNVALPSIQKDLGFSERNLQWVVSAYALLFGGLLLLGGRVADLLGPRRRCEELRRARPGARHRRPRHAGLRDHAGEQLRLGVARDDRPLRRLARVARGVRRLGVADGRAADAVRDLPAAHRLGRERRR